MDKRFFKGTIEEISDQKALLETELERRERLKSVGILAAGMAHEIKNPITAIRTFAEYLPKKYEDAEFREKFSRLIVEETDRVSEIVRDLLLFARPSDPVIKPFDLQGILKGLLDLLKADFLKHSVEPALSVDSDVPRCLADSQQVRQAFLNIIMNAVDAMKIKEGKRHLSLTVSRGGGGIAISCGDTGIGIPEDKIGHLFDPFYTNKEDGTGLGLAITYSIIEKNNGRISVRSSLQEGTVFTVILPAA